MESICVLQSDMHPSVSRSPRVPRHVKGWKSICLNVCCLFVLFDKKMEASRPGDCFFFFFFCIVMSRPSG